MFLKCHPRIKDGKEHRYWSVVENRRCGRGKFEQRQVLYLGEINDSQRESWCRTIQVFDEKREQTVPLALFPADRQLPDFAAGFFEKYVLDKLAKTDGLVMAAASQQPRSSGILS
jgi:hypothetical protein